jgi:putative membrane protein
MQMKNNLWIGVMLMAASTLGAPAGAEVLSDGQVAKVLLTINDGEIDAAKLALKKSKNDDIKSFATAMESQHKENSAQSKQLIKKDKLEVRESGLSKALKSEAEAENKKIKQAAGEFDKLYVAEQIKMHEKALKTIDDDLLPNAKNPDLHSHLQTTRSAVAEHLEHAKALQSKFE